MVQLIIKQNHKPQAKGFEEKAWLNGLWLVFTIVRFRLYELECFTKENWQLNIYFKNNQGWFMIRVVGYWGK